MNYIILIILILLTGLSLYTSYIYNNIYLRIIAGAILLILGLALFSGVSYPTEEITTDVYNLYTQDNSSIPSECSHLQTGTITKTTVKNYTNWNDYSTKAIALILVLAGALIFIYQPLEQKTVI